MRNSVVMLEQDRGVQLVQGWGLSIALHGCLILAVMAAMPKLTLTLDEEPFRWDVALVSAPPSAPTVSTPVQSAQEPVPSKPAPLKKQPARPPDPAPQVFTRQVQPQEARKPVLRERQPVQRDVLSVQQELESVQRDIQPLQREIEPVQRDAEPMERAAQPVLEAERPTQQMESAREVVAMETMETERQERTKPEAVVDRSVTAEVVRENTPVAEHHAAQVVPQETREAPAPIANESIPETRPEPELIARVPVAESPPPMPVEKPSPVRPVQPVPDPIESTPVQPAPATNDSPAPGVQEQAPVVARSITPNPAKKADYGWLAESLHRRIVELRHYPNTARLNGWEGKVVLRVQIRRDGNLDNVSVVKSSGHETLDNAAMEAVRRACPLHLKHELTAPMVVVQVPINYSLNR